MPPADKLCTIHNYTNRRKAGPDMSKQVFPGDELSSIEEYAAGYGAYDDGQSVRASIIGQSVLNSQERVIGSSGPLVPVPRPGDTVIGEVAVTLSSRLIVTIRFVNGRRVTNNVECVLSTRNIRMRIVALAGDVMVLKIVSILNGNIHATVDEPQLGVLFTKCRRCGMGVITHRDAVKCAECGWIDDRKLSSEFGQSGFVKAQ